MSVQTHAVTQICPKISFPPDNILKILQWNICSFRSKKDHLIEAINECHPDIIFLNETWLLPVHNIRVSGYHIMRQDRMDGYGGIVILIRSKLAFNLSKHIQSSQIKSLCAILEQFCQYISGTVPHNGGHERTPSALGYYSYK